MSDVEKRLPEEWERDQGYRIVDPDGWRTKGLSWRTPISLELFTALAGASTVEYVPWAPGLPEPVRDWA